MRHKNITYSADGSKVRMKTDRIFYYDRALSCAKCSQDVKLTVPNLLLFVRSSVLRPLPSRSHRFHFVSRRFTERSAHFLAL